MPVQVTISGVSNMWAIAWAILQNVSLRVWKWIGIVGGVLLACLYFFSSGKRAARRRIAEDNAKLIERQFEESMKAPKSQEETVQHLREKGL